MPIIYTGQGVALLTQHGNEKVIAPVLDIAQGCQLDLSQDVEMLDFKYMEKTQ